MSTTHRTTYLEYAHLYQRAIVEQTRRALETIQFDYIAFTGLSGALIAPVVACLMDKQMIAIRKDDEHYHAAYRIEGPKIPGRYVIVDDLMSSGDTIRNIIQDVFSHLHTEHKCVGIYLWATPRSGLYTQDIPYLFGPLNDLTAEVESALAKDRCGYEPVSVFFHD